MSLFRQFTSRIPYWAFALVILVVVVNSLYLYFRFRIPDTGLEGEFQNGQVVITKVFPGGPADKAGIQAGDIIKSIDSVIPTAEYYLIYRQKAGDKESYLMVRNDVEFSTSVINASNTAEYFPFFLAGYILILFLSVGSIYILYKKSDDPAVQIFFIYIQLFAMASNAGNLFFQDPLSSFSNTGFIFGGCISVSALIHFHLLFPKPSLIYSRFKWLPLIFYLTGSLGAMVHSIKYDLFIYYPTMESYTNFYLSDRVQITWMTLAFSIALGLAVYQFITIKNTLARNQLRIVIIGSFFGFITPMALAIFYDFDFISQLATKFPFFLIFFQGIGSLIMIICFLIAIFRYRIWGTEIFIRKALLYLSATFIITFTYLLLIFLVDRLTISETNITRFISLAVSVIVFLVLRDSILHLIERLFHRETYDSATVVSDFEEKLAGIYQIDDLKHKIVTGLDEIFHFKSFIFNLKKKEFVYEPAFVLGIDNLKIDKEFEVTLELENSLRKSKVFSPDELSKKPAVLDISNGELIVPLLAGDQPFGFFVCGQKQSERVYSLQDIRVLSLLARRVVALFHTASLYQKDLDRQLMLERERARISQDMHDDIGAGLTKIAMISEAGSGEQGTVSSERRIVSGEQGTVNSERMVKVATTAREMINRLNVIVWALNPRYDNLESLVSYARRYFGEYLENFGISFRMEVPAIIPDQTVTPDFRRNAFYAWQEAIHNAVKHAACSEVTFEMKINDQTMLVNITDNGKGFDQASPGSGGNGLLNMKKRAEEMGGTFEIESVPGSRTCVMFTIRLKANSIRT